MIKMSAKISLLLGSALWLAASAGLPASAQDGGLSLRPPESELTHDGAINFNVRNDAPQRSSTEPHLDTAETEPPRRLELELAASGQSVGAPLDISIAHRSSFGADQNGDFNRQGRGAEVRVGRNLMDAPETSEGRNARWYVFAASDDEAVTWRPGGRGDLTGVDSLTVQDRVEIGDLQAGVTYERGGVQASIAYVEREISSTVGRHTVSRDENFAGVTLTMRR